MTAGRFVFRVDSSRAMGYGHVMRCLTIAGELARRAAEVTFVCRELPGNAITRIVGEGHRVERLPAPGKASSMSWFQVEPEIDSEQTRSVLARLNPDWLVVDHYGIDAGWERAQRSDVGRILVIDDLADRVHDCDVLLDQNYFGDLTARRYDAWIPAGARRLLGPRYALLRPEYLRLRRSQPDLVQSPARAKRVLVFFGTDATDETGKVLRALNTPALEHLEVDVVLGPSHPAVEDVDALVAARPSTRLFMEPPSLAELMAKADLAIGAGGTTTSERLCLRLPSIVITVAGNQEQPTAQLAKEGFVIAGGVAPISSVERLATLIADSLNLPKLARTLVDGYGTLRVAAALVPPKPTELRLHKAHPADCELLYDWRNEPLAREMSLNSDLIAWESHARWFEARLRNPDVELFIASIDGLPAGQARLEYTGDEAVLSYSVEPVLRGLGFGKAIVQNALQCAGRQPAAGFVARVKATNAASRRIFESLGWSDSVEGGEIVYRKAMGVRATASLDDRARAQDEGQR
jgi:UDP-2,4-diacetamido-2,4,6-trideoxy-beta-L-altropyranose hydrolase